VLLVNEVELMEQVRAWGAQLASLFRATVEDLISYVPGILLTVLLLAVGWLLARLIKSATAMVIERMDWLFVHATARSAEAASNLQRAIARALSTLVFWAILLSFVAAALRSLGWPIIESWTEALFAYVPVLVGGVLIILVGFVAGALARGIVEPAAAGVGVAHSALIGRLIQAAVVISGVVIGVSELGIDVSFLVQLVTVIAAAAFGGVALALALGTRAHLLNLVGARYLRKHYQVGDQIRVGQLEGRIVQIADGCVFLETEDGDLSVPGVYFSRQAFLRLNDGRGQ
jgi:hypothetical protein